MEFFLVEIGVAGPCRRGVHGFVVASSGVLSKGYGHGGADVCLGDGQTETSVGPCLYRGAGHMLTSGHRSHASKLISFEILQEVMEKKI